MRTDQLRAAQRVIRAKARSPRAINLNPVSAIPDSRWVNAGFQGFGYEPGDRLSVSPAFCAPLQAAMNDLANSLEAAYASGYQDQLTVKQAASVFDSNYKVWERTWVVNPFGNSCENMVREVTNATAAVNSLLGSNAPAPLRPDYDPNKEADQGLGWVPWVAGVGLVLYGLTVLAPFVGLIPKPK